MILISATNRGSKRVESDFYATPISVVNKFLEHHKLQNGAILECTAGNGNIVEAIYKKGYRNLITSVEIRNEYENLKRYSNEIYIDDFLIWQPKVEYKTIISNPPYSLAKEIIEKCFELANINTEIIMLLRLAFLESKKRYEFWQQHPVNKLYILSERPSFTGKGTDATAYAWFVWDGSDKQEIKVI